MQMPTYFSWYKRKSKWHRNQRFFSSCSYFVVVAQLIFVCVILFVPIHFICTFSAMDGLHFSLLEFFFASFSLSVSFLLSFASYTLLFEYTQKNEKKCAVLFLFFFSSYLSPPVVNTAAAAAVIIMIIYRVFNIKRRQHNQKYTWCWFVCCVSFFVAEICARMATDRPNRHGPASLSDWFDDQRTLNGRH